MRLEIVLVAAHLLMGIVACAEEAEPPAPRTILTYAERLGLSEEQREAIRPILDDVDRNLHLIKDELTVLALAIDELAAREADLEEIKARLVEEEEVRVRARHLAIVGSIDIARVLTEPQRQSWQYIKTTNGLSTLGPIWPVARDEAPPVGVGWIRNFRAPLDTPTVELSDEQFRESRELLNKKAKALREIRARMTIADFELEELVDQGGDLEAIRANLKEQARLRVLALLSEIETQRKLLGLLGEDQRRAWMKYQEEARNPKGGAPPPDTESTDK